MAPSGVDSNVSNVPLFNPGHIVVLHKIFLGKQEYQQDRNQTDQCGRDHKLFIAGPLA